MSGVYGGILSLGYNTELQAKKKLPVPKCWKDLLDPAYKNEVMLGNPNSSGTAYLMLASLVQVFGEDEAFKYMKALNANVSSYARSGIGPMTAVKQGEIYVGSTVLHGVINEIAAGFPVRPVLPCEGVGYEIGSMAIIKGARNLDNAKRFVDWALTVDAQKIGLDDQGVRDPDQQERAAAGDGAEPDRVQGHQLRFREVRLERDAEAPARALGEGDRPSAAMTGTRRAERAVSSGSPSARSGSCSSRGTRCRTACSRSPGFRNFTTKEAAPGAAADPAARQGLARPARR